MLDRFVHKWLRAPYTLHTRIVSRPRRPRATILFIHGIGNSGEAWNEVVSMLPSDIRVITIDLLGFGKSPRPEWAVYNAKTQARSVLATLLKIPITSPIIIVGHSLGALVAVEVAKRYPLLVKSLILCNPPFYKQEIPEERALNLDRLLRGLYRSAYGRPERFTQLAAFAKRYRLVNKAFDVTPDNVDVYMATLHAMIINQTALDDARTLQMPIHIIRGALDPFMVVGNLKSLTKSGNNVTLATVPGFHEVQGPIVSALVTKIEKVLSLEQDQLAKKKPHDKV